MIPVYFNIFVGSDADYFSMPRSERQDWAIVHASKDPWHRKAVGYRTVSPPKGHPNRLFKIVGSELYLNLLDAPDMKHIPFPVVKKALSFIDHWVQRKKIFIHCNQGKSRGPSIAFIYMMSKGVSNYRKPEHFKFAQIEFRMRYPKYNPSKGMVDMSRIYWDAYCKKQQK